MQDSAAHAADAHAPKFETIPLSPLEISGAVSTQIMHDLSNLISGIVGNAEYAEKLTNDPAGQLRAIQAVRSAANDAAKLLGQCLPLQSALSSAALVCDTSDMAERIAEGAGLNPGWRSVPPPGLHGQIKVQPRWLAAAIWQIARETGSTRGEIDFVSGPSAFPIAWQGVNPNPGHPIHLFQITLCYRAEEPLFTRESPATPERPGLLAALELIRRCKAQFQAHPKPPGRQEISILIPLA